MPESGGMNVKSNTDCIRLRNFFKFKKNIQKSVYRICVDTAFCGKKLYTVKRPVYNAVSVQHKKFQSNHLPENHSFSAFKKPAFIRIPSESRQCNNNQSVMPLAPSLSNIQHASTIIEIPASIASGLRFSGVSRRVW